MKSNLQITEVYFLEYFRIVLSNAQIYDINCPYFLEIEDDFR